MEEEDFARFYVPKFYEISKKDLEASNLLFNNKLYPQAVFYFEQSVEKAVKALGIHFKLLKEENDFKNMHHVIKIFYRWLNSLRDFINIVFKTNKEYESKKETVLFLDFFNTMLESIKPVRDKKESLRKEQLNEDNIEDTINDIKNTIDAFKNAIDDIKNTYSRSNETVLILNIMDNISVMSYLMSLSNMIDFHAINARYPDFDINFDPLIYYKNENLPLIKFSSDLIEIMRIILSKMEMQLKKESISLAFEDYLKCLENKQRG